MNLVLIWPLGEIALAVSTATAASLQVVLLARAISHERCPLDWRIERHRAADGRGDGRDGNRGSRSAGDRPHGDDIFMGNRAGDAAADRRGTHLSGRVPDDERDESCECSGADCPSAQILRVALALPVFRTQNPCSQSHQ